ncbi:uncharacterized protein TRIADDRAFT_61311 [Trichoplax adhaerens]|uniref:Cell cycle checkpoint control protein RAD9A n=1 Tax=Trichoplax adhaerens TaxID=10228 RepID=B3SAM4_TRIAD|nr:hypothetical protein TRIADDRAFT_61311 [Trichoplax adhaerens]EDV20180.1 hypothetical protein TRIADDRAFT_61311 [Trichoplax adhaerens]|eukprot:XP_002117341.1 hypothetical protein TRIADDRAFT_61311 [Trichoplax adhaerens]
MSNTMAFSAIAVIPGKSVKVFGKAIQCLSKVGDELYVQINENGIDLRTVNSSRSAYSRMEFKSRFFSTFRVRESDSGGSDSILKCKINMKPCLNIFRSSSTDKNVNSCSITLDGNENRLKFLLECRFGIRKAFDLLLQDCESLEAMFTKDDCPNAIVSLPKIFSNTICNFHASQEEITLVATKENIIIKNYVEDQAELIKMLYTEMNLATHEFLSYDVKTEGDITFCLKEFRAIVSFGEYTGQPISMHFESAGKPIMFHIAKENTFTADFVLASLVDTDTPSQRSNAFHQNTTNLDDSHCHIIEDSILEKSNLEDDSATQDKRSSAHLAQITQKSNEEEGRRYFSNGYRFRGRRVIDFLSWIFCGSQYLHDRRG